MQRPITLPQAAKEHLHTGRKCIDVRDHQAFSIKFNTNNRTWHNTVGVQHATVSVNPRTYRDNTLVYAGQPIHVLSFGCGPDTYYWGRYRCLGGKARKVFQLEYVDDGDLKLFGADALQGKRSRLEQQWEKTFEQAEVQAVYEPATIRLSREQEYTPDFWLPEQQLFVEIKGPMPTPGELDKCVKTTEKGFAIQMFRGPPSDFTVYDWDKTGTPTTTHYTSFYRYQHPAGKRQKRTLVNIS
jgi:hypothetical protein